MKKLFPAAFALLWSVGVLAQDQTGSIQKEFQGLMKNTTGILYGNNPAAGRYYTLRGFRMYAETYGSGLPLLIIHGNGGDISNFVNQIPFFSKKYKVIVADSRAQGRSADTGDSLSYEMMADDYAALLDQMKIDSAFVIGWSDGGINGLLLAIRHPVKVKKLAVTGANLWPDTTAVFDDVVQLVLPRYHALKDKTDKTAGEKASWKLMRLLIEEPHIPLTDLQKISVPALIIGGDHDVIRPEHTLLIARHIPESYLWILPGSGHSTPVMFKNEFNQKVEGFFSTPFRKIESVSRFF